jgi:hypothetical protein
MVSTGATRSCNQTEVVSGRGGARHSRDAVLAETERSLGHQATGSWRSAVPADQPRLTIQDTNYQQAGDFSLGARERYVTVMGSELTRTALNRPEHGWLCPINVAVAVHRPPVDWRSYPCRCGPPARYRR